MKNWRPISLFNISTKPISNKLATLTGKNYRNNLMQQFVKKNLGGFWLVALSLPSSSCLAAIDQ